jgi:putative ABC transport system permease protein
MESIIKDLRYAIRQLVRRPGFTVIALLTLALGIGANTAIFSVVNAVVLKPLPYKQPDQLVMLWETIAANDHRSVAPGNFADWREQNHTMEAMAATFNGNFNLTGDGFPERIDGATVTSNLMDVLGVPAQLGRVFQSDDDLHQDRRLVVISDALWKRRFASGRDLIGQTIKLDDTSYEVVGVMPPGFQYPNQANLWVLGRDRNAVSQSLISQFPQNDWSHERDAHFINIIGRLKPGVTLSQAQSDIATISRQLEQQFPQSNAGLGSNVVSLHTQIVGNVQPLLLLLLGAVIFVLLIACTNVANLLLARASQRQREVALRLAVGASRARLIRQFLTESILLSLVGGSLGFVVSIWAVALFVKLSPSDIPRLNEVGVDLRMLGFILAVSVITGVCFGLLPAFQATRPDLNRALKDVTRASQGRSRRRSRDFLVIAELALAQLLLVAAGLLIVSYVRLNQIDAGFNPDHVLTAKIAPSTKKYPDPKRRAEFFTAVLDHLRQIPGVQSAAIVLNLPLSGSSMNRGFTVEGRPPARPDENITMDYQVVSSDYFAVLETPILRGRGFTAADNENSQRVIIINQTMARRYWPSEDPLGKRMAIGDSSKETSWRTIVGVVGDIRHASLNDVPVPCAFTIYRQDLESWPRMAITIKTTTDPASLSGAVRKELTAIDPTQPVYAVEPFQNLLSSALAPRRYVMVLLGSFSLLALILAIVGVYGVISFSVSERTNEIGIRVALGASRRDVLRLILGHGMGLALIGIVMGLAGAFAVTRFLRSFLFEVTATDPGTFTLVALILGAVALCACYIPARRASKVDPLVALKYE